MPHVRMCTISRLELSRRTSTRSLFFLARDMLSGFRGLGACVVVWLDGWMDAASVSGGCGVCVVGRLVGWMDGMDAASVKCESVLRRVSISSVLP